eukprot:COSAG02_NODE_988_length_15440_cov_5.979271_12_plen_70_part_00
MATIVQTQQNNSCVLVSRVPVANMRTDLLTAASAMLLKMGTCTMKLLYRWLLSSAAIWGGSVNNNFPSS